MKFAATLPLSLLLAACSTTEPVVKTVVVEVPVPVPCVREVPQVKAYAFDNAQVNMPLDQKAQLLTADRLQRMGTEKELRAVLSACTAR